MNKAKALLTIALTALATISCQQGKRLHTYDGDIPFPMRTLALPSIPGREVSITDFGAKGDGVTLCTRNLQMPMDLEAEGCGIWLEPYDREGWERAIRYIIGHPEEAREMGRRGRLLAEKYYNVEQCAREVALLLK